MSTFLFFLSIGGRIEKRRKWINLKISGKLHCFIQSCIVAKQEPEPQALLCLRFFPKLCEQESWVTSKLVRN